MAYQQLLDRLVSISILGLAVEYATKSEMFGFIQEIKNEVRLLLKQTDAQNIKCQLQNILNNKIEKTASRDEYYIYIESIKK